MKSLKNYAVFTLFSLACSLNAQEKSKFLRDDNQEIKDLTKKVGDNGWLEFKEGNKTKHTDFFTKHKSAFGLNAKDKMDVMRENREEKTNYKHYRMQQSYGGVPIEGAEFFLHYNAKDELDVANGKLVENLTISSTPKITADKALIIALKEFKDVVFLWQDTARENSLKRETGNILATYKPKGELVITFPENEELKSSKAILAYVFDVDILRPQGSWKYYIDAQNGNLIKKRNNEINCDHPRTLTFVSLYNGNQSTSSCRRNYGFLGLGGIGNFLGTDQWNLNFSIRDFVTECEIQRNWEDWGTTDQQYTTANWALENAWVYFRDVHGRNGWDGNGKQAKLFVNPTGVATSGRAGYSPTLKTMLFSQGTMSLDITGHEFAHGVVNHSAMLNGTAISRSLDESFGDIFGEMAERRTTGFTNWRIGDQVPWASLGWSLFFRDLLVPASSTTPQPSTFLGANWDFSNDINFPHTNGGVQNRWFSLLALGSTNGAPHAGPVVQGIGADAAASIAFYNLTHFLGANSNYQDARDGAITSARILFGCGSNELLQTWRAWNAVNLATPMPAPLIETNLIYQCESSLTASISPCWFQGATYSWSNISSVAGVVSGVNNNTLTFNIKTVKNATVTLTATFQGNTVNIPISIRVNKCTGGPIPIRNPNGNPNDPVFSINPNPAYEMVNIDLKDVNNEGIYKVNVVNSVGQVMKVEALKQSQNQISLSGLANGLYNIVIYDSAGGIKQSSKIIKSPY